MNKIKRKILVKDILYTEENPEGIKHEIIEMICPVCNKKWITAYINSKVILGGTSTYFKKGKEYESCGCDMWKNFNE